MLSSKCMILLDTLTLTVTEVTVEDNHTKSQFQFKMGSP